MSILNREIPSESRATLLSVISFVFQTGGLIGSLAGGFVSEAKGIGFTWQIGAVILIISGFAYLRVSEKKKMQELKMKFNAIGKKTQSERIAQIVKEAIINGEIKAGETLPTETELMQQFNVSRAVIRDAARILMAWGLIDIRHGKGMYVTMEMNSYFMEAISTILRRGLTSSWEMQEYEQFLLPEIFAKAAVNCSEIQMTEIENRGKAYIDFIWTGKDDAVLQKELFLDFMDVIYEASKNRVLSLMGRIQGVLREMRTITNDEGREEELIALEEKSVRIMIEAVKSGDSEQSKEMVSGIFKVGPKIEKIMREVPLGHKISIPADIIFEELGI